MTTPPPTTRHKSPAELARFLTHLANCESHSLGFIPGGRYAEYLEAGQVLTAWENDEPCGFLLRGPARPVLKVYQTAVCFDARRILHAAKLVADLQAYGIANNCERIRLHCAHDLDANLFWRAMGFELVAQIKRRRRRGRLLLRWELALPAEAARLHQAGRDLEKKGLTNLRRLLTNADDSVRTLRVFNAVEPAK